MEVIRIEGSDIIFFLFTINTHGDLYTFTKHISMTSKVQNNMF